MQEPYRLQGKDGAADGAVTSAIVAYKLLPQICDVLRKDTTDAQSGSLIGLLAIGGREVGYFRLQAR